MRRGGGGWVGEKTEGKKWPQVRQEAEVSEVEVKIAEAVGSGCRWQSPRCVRAARVRRVTVRGEPRGEVVVNGSAEAR